MVVSSELKHLLNLKILEKDNDYVCMRGEYCYWKDGPKKFVELSIKDSYRLIPMKLADIPNNLDFKDVAQKEVMYYDRYNHNTMGRITKMGQKEFEEYITKFNENSQDTPEDLQDMADTFLDNHKNWKCINDDGTYDLLAYSKHYCMTDCEVLKIGLDTGKSCGGTLIVGLM